MIVETLQKHYAPKTLVIVKRFHFHHREQCSGESVAEYGSVEEAVYQPRIHGLPGPGAKGSLGVWPVQWRDTETFISRGRFLTGSSNVHHTRHGSSCQEDSIAEEPRTTKFKPTHKNTAMSPPCPTYHYNIQALEPPLPQVISMCTR